MAQYPANILLSSLDGTNGFRLIGQDQFDRAGISVSYAGDINDDGFADIVIGAYEGNNDAGAAYVIYGKAGGFSADLDLNNLDGTNGFKISGAVSGDYLGRSVHTAGDVNGDGWADVILGAYGAAPHGAQSGAAYVVFGNDAGIPANIDVTTLNGTNGFKLSGAVAGDFTGFAVSNAGDVNGDHIDDMIVGAQLANSNGPDSGTIFIVFGKTTGFAANIDLATINGSNGFGLIGEGVGYEGGISVSSAGDFNGDGISDLLVGASDAHPHGAQSGRAYVVFGKSTGFAVAINLSSLNGAEGFKMSGAAASDQAGFSVAAAGDVNADGFADIIVGAYSADSNGANAGTSYVVFGKGGGFSNIDLSTLHGPDGFLINGAAAGEISGYSVAGAGDVNGDGFDDVIVGAWRANAPAIQTGAAYVVFGGVGGFGGHFDLVNIDGTNGFKLSGDAGGDDAGVSVSSAGVVIGDGLADLLVGASVADVNGIGSGAAYVVFGQLPDAAVNRTGTNAGQNLVGGNFDDTLNLKGGDDHLFGHGGNDLLIGGAGNDVLDGGSGTDTADYSSDTAGVTVSLTSGQASGTLTGDDTLIGIENVKLGSGNDIVLSGASGGSLFDLSAGGNDIVAGGNGDDGFYFGGAFDTNDHVVGGPGGNDQLGLEGDYSAGLILSGSNIQGVEVIAMLPGFTYEFQTDDALVAAGDTLTFWAVSMGSANLVSIDAGTEADGYLKFFLGQGNDTIIGGAAGNLFYGEGGIDTLFGGAGVDTFAYLGVSDSTGLACDLVRAVTVGQDKLVLPFAVNAIDA